MGASQKDLHGRGADQGHRRVNISQGERLASLVTGGALLGVALWQRKLVGLLAGLTGGALLVRGATGHCEVSHALGRNTAAPQPIRVARAVTISRTPDDLYRFFRNFENLPHVMDHLKEVRVIDERRSHWVARAPADSQVEWDAEILREEPGRLIVWRSLPGADVPSSGSVSFEPQPGDRGTVVRVTLAYDPPAGKLGALVASLFGEEPSQQIEEDLRHFKQVMETGEIPRAMANGHSRKPEILGGAL